VKTKRYSSVDGYYGGHGDSIYYPPTWEWEGEALETDDDAELSKNLDRIVLGQLLIVKDLLTDLKEVGESQRENLLHVLGFLISKGVSVVDLVQNLSPRSVSVIGVDGLNLLSRDPCFRDMSSDVLARFGKPAIKLLIKMSNQDEKQSPSRQRTMEALGEIGDGEEVIEFLMQSLKKEFDIETGAPRNPDYKSGRYVGLPQTARATIAALGKAGDERAYLPILMLHHSLTPHYVGTNTYVMEKMSSQRNAEMSLLGEALHRLKKKLTEKSVEPLIQALKDPMSEVSGWAIVGLGEIGDERAAESLIQILFDDKRTWAHADVAKALGKIGGEKAIDALKRVRKKHCEKNIRDLADGVLKQLKG
jgi:HEAT repeat protein